MSDFFSKTWSDNFRSVLIDEKEKEHRKKYFIIVQEIITFLRTFELLNVLLDIEKSNSKRLFSNDSKCKKITTLDQSLTKERNIPCCPSRKLLNQGRKLPEDR